MLQYWQSEAFKSSDMFMKCRYMDEMTGGKELSLPQERLNQTR